MPAERVGVTPAHLNDRMVVEAYRVRGRPAAMPPIGAGHLDPSSRPDIAEAAPLWVGDVTGLGDEGGELRIRRFETHELEPRHRHRPECLVWTTVGIARFEAAGGNRNHLERGLGLARRNGQRNERQHDRCDEQAPESCCSFGHASLSSPAATGRSAAGRPRVRAGRRSGIVSAPAGGHRRDGQQGVQDGKRSDR